MKENLISWLFETKALRVCPQENPFWYSSGAIGPYYINTHFLYGNESKANDLLEFIDEQKDDTRYLLKNLDIHIQSNFNTDKIFYNLIHALKDSVLYHVPVHEIDMISGGERRDWFFSIMMARICNKPHATILKDHSVWITKDGESREALADDLQGKKVLHVADLINEGSSYERAWVPSIHNLGGRIKWSIAVVDRKQGGEEKLISLGVKSYALLDISKEMFKNAKQLNYITEDQYQMILEYIDNPRESMERFLRNNPEFLKRALHSDEKVRQRANLCLSNKIYGDLPL